MEYGFSVPTRGPIADPDSILAIARHGEALGFDYIAIPDHIVVPTEVASTYPYSADGTWAGKAMGSCFEQLTLMAWVAQATSRAKLLTSVMVIPHRQHVQTAKMLATIDVLSGGRVVLGVGTGWMREEFEALSAPDFDARGQITDEYLEAFRALWEQDKPAYAGEFAPVANLTFEPKPVSRIPFWIGGESAPALRRAARHGDCWYPVGTNPRFPCNTIARYSRRVDRLRELAADIGRDPETIELAYWANWAFDKVPLPVEDGERHLFVGDAEAIASDVSALAEVGVTRTLFNFQRPTLQATLDDLSHFAEEIRPRVTA
jgi:probable F420-dependent oxidoreductase